MSSFVLLFCSLFFPQTSLVRGGHWQGLPASSDGALPGNDVDDDDDDGDDGDDDDDVDFDDVGVDDDVDDYDDD